jgi:3-methyladenine DNA glycosylase Tag
MEGPPPQYTAKTLDDYLEHLSKGVFQAGISWRVVDAKWATIRPAFHGFKVERVARMTDREIDALTKDERVIRSRPKIAAVVHNANELLALERAGGFKRHLKSFADFEALASDLKKRFKFVGDSGVYHFLWTVKHPVPDWHEWAKAHGKDWGVKTTTARPRVRRVASTGASARAVDVAPLSCGQWAAESRG